MSYNTHKGHYTDQDVVLVDRAVVSIIAKGCIVD